MLPGMFAMIGHQDLHWQCCSVACRRLGSEPPGRLEESADWLRDFRAEILRAITFGILAWRSGALVVLLLINGLGYNSCEPQTAGMVQFFAIVPRKRPIELILSLEDARPESGPGQATSIRPQQETS